MSTTYELRTFKDIIDAVCEELGIQSTDTVARNRIRRDINIVYQDEVIPFEEWKWLRGFTNLTLNAKITAGTASVTQNSKTVTLTIAPGICVEGYWFATDGWNERYQVAKHTANSTTLVLDAPFSGATLSAQSYTLWTDKLALPADCRETLKVTQDFMSQPLDNMGLQRFRDISNTNPKVEARPQYYTTSDYVDPQAYAAISGLPALSTRASSGLVKTLVFASDVSSYLSAGDRIRVYGAGSDDYNGKWVVSTVSTTTVTFTGQTRASESATADATLSVEKLTNQIDSEKYRELWVYPSIFNQKVTLHVDYIKEVSPLVNDTDEPLVPLQDRTVLLYGALQRAWSRNRNPEEAARNGAMYDRKLIKMAGKLDDSTDTPVLRPARSYLSTKRRGQRFRGESYSGGYGAGGSSGPQPTITGASNRVAIFDSTGTLAASSTISTTELGLLDGLTSVPVTASDAAVLTNKTISGSSNTLSNIPNSATTATSANTASAIVARDASGNFTAGTITASLSGNATTATSATTATTATNFSGSLSGDVTGTQGATAITNLARTKLSAGTANAVCINDSSGFITSEAALSPARGGTGVANNAAATLTRSGNHAVTLTTTNTTSLTLPTSGTLAVTTTQSRVRVENGNGHGSTNNKIRRYSTSVVNTGSAITYADSATNGASFTINEAGLYAISLADRYSNASGAANFGISLNGSALTTSILTITNTERIAISQTGPAASVATQICTVIQLAVNDVIRPHDDGNPDGTDVRTYFEISKVGQ